MSDTIEVPVAGRMNKKIVIGGLVVVAGVVGYAYWRRSLAPAEGPIEPGIEDYTGGVQTGGSGSTTGGLAYLNPPPADVDPDDLPPTTNAQWTQRGVDYMQNLAFDAQFVATTLGKYLARVPVIDREADVIRTVEGAIGKPPIGEYRIIQVSTPPANPPANEPPAATTMTVPANADLYYVLPQLGAQHGVPGYDIGRMRALNPGIDSKISWPVKPAPVGKIPVFTSPQTVKIR